MAKLEAAMHGMILESEDQDITEECNDQQWFQSNRYSLALLSVQFCVWEFCYYPCFKSYHSVLIGLVSPYLLDKLLKMAI